ncbi:hypothetical protein H0V99_01140 [Candidatus Saccharibacteria bacterium]|nr:hypothetical protein [Candidatus Saccharibacteria bacterium]
MPKTNISKRQYHNLVDDIEHEPLVRHTTLAAACLLAAMCILAGSLAWFAKSHPGNLIRTTGTVSNVTSGLTDRLGTVTTFATFDFETREGKNYSVRQPTGNVIPKLNQDIPIGYNPLNPAYARNLSDTQPPLSSVGFWSVPFILMGWLILIALFRHHTRQVEIWKAAEAADADD